MHHKCIGSSHLCVIKQKTLLMQIIGKLIEILPLQTGEGKNGTWKKQDIIVETQMQYPKKVCIGLWNDKIDSTFLQVGNDLVIDIVIESRTYNGRWYTEVKAWKVALLMEEYNQKSETLNTDFAEIDTLPF